MFLETVKSDGIAHLGYIFGDQGEACVVDPRRDCHIFMEIAQRNRCRITKILETHRNEDLVSGSPILARYTGARVYHGPNADGDVEYAQIVRDGDQFHLGALRVEVLETPGHTYDSLSFLLFDTHFERGPVAAFTGDTLFIGDVGRTDFYPDRKEEVAGLLFDSLQKINRRAEHAQLYPAHGAGSVCGDGMAEREFSTVAHEFANNPMLRIDSRSEFIEKKLAEFHYQPPYFSRMEKLNLIGAEPTPFPLAPRHFTWHEYLELCDADNSFLTLDVRGIEAFLGAHIPGSLCLPVNMISAYAGWLLNDERSMLLVANDAGQAELARRHLTRIGYDRQFGFLDTDLASIAAQGAEFSSITVVDTDAVNERLEQLQEWTLIDVRKLNEVKQKRIDGARHHFLGTLENDLHKLCKSNLFTVMCGSGVRATVGASILKMNGFNRVDVYLGSMGAWSKAGLRTVESQ